MAEEQKWDPKSEEKGQEALSDIGTQIAMDVARVLHMGWRVQFRRFRGGLESDPGRPTLVKASVGLDGYWLVTSPPMSMADAAAFAADVVRKEVLERPEEGNPLPAGTRIAIGSTIVDPNAREDDAG